MSKKEAKGIENSDPDCDNPISLDEIEKGLWLGWFTLKFGAFNLLLIQCLMQFLGSFSAATDVETLKQRNITHILTLDICPLPVHITELPFLKTKYIQGINCHTFYKLKRFFNILYFFSFRYSTR